MTNASEDDRGRRVPPYVGGEFETLLAYLDYHRDTLLTKAEGLTDTQLQQTHPPSSLSIAALLHHLAFVEESWVLEVLLGQQLGTPWQEADFDGDVDWEITAAASMSGARLRDQFARSRQLCDSALHRLAGSPDGMDALSPPLARRDGQRYTVRWVLVHLVEEYARHNGHADLIRESIDGVTGE